MLLKLWEECLKESLDAETRSRIIGCKGQMKTFNFFFGVCLGQRHYSLTDNLSKTLQNEKMSAVSGQRLASLIAKTIQSMGNDSDFDLFYQAVSKKAKKLMIVDCPENDASEITLSCSSLVAMRKCLMQLSHTTQLPNYSQRTL